jgi:transposase
LDHGYRAQLVHAAAVPQYVGLKHGNDDSDACDVANRRSGNRYLAWSYIEAANFAIRWSPQIRRWYDRKRAKRHRMIAIKAVAHKIARACYYLLRDGTRFEVQRAFA